MGKVLGIDLGTTNSVMAVMQGGEPTVITNVEGGRTTPSIVAMSKNAERLVGQIAKRQAIINPENTIFSIKRLIGRAFEDEEVQRDLKLLPYKIVKSNSHVKVAMGDKEYSPEEISAMILAKMKADAETYLNEKITEAVITVPAYFNDSQRQATKDAGKIAGLEVKRIINEPTAAALSYGLDKKKEEKIAVFDLGGGTFDISILELGEGVFEVKSTNGDTHLGGDDFDQRIIDWLVDEFKKDQGVDLTNDKTALQRLKEGAEKAKIELTTTQESEINIPFITADQSGPKHLALKLTRAKLYELVKDLIDKVEEPVNQAFSDAGLSASDINEVILVGGMTRMPEIQDKVKSIFGKDPLKGVNPDEVVAVGAAIQGGVLTGEVKDILLLDVTPLTLGIETLGGVSTPMIERNTTVPTSKTQVFSTADDNQPMVEVHVLQGERPMALDNKSLGRFMLDGIPPAPRGLPQIEVTFDIDANGILSVKAKDKATAKEQHITIEGSSSLSKEDVEKMKKEAELHAEEDKKKTELAEAKNIGSTMLYTAEKSLKDAGDKITDEERKPIKEKEEALKKSLESDSVDEIKTATDALSSELQKIGSKLYEEAKDSPTGSEQESPAGEGEQAKDSSTSSPQDAEVVEEAEQAAKEAEEGENENTDDDKK